LSRAAWNAERCPVPAAWCRTPPDMHTARMAPPTHAAFLRAVNLGGRRRVSSGDLHAAFDGTGLAPIHTFRASGNVVFAAPRATEAELIETIERALGGRLGFAVPVYLRTAAELRALVTAGPFAGDRGSGTQRLQVALLTSRPSKRLREQVLGYATSDDLLSFGKRELLWLATGSTQGARLNLRAIERLLGPWTMRTMETIDELVLRHFS
jgi:uncharacterized protein (DUF1697 family)